MPHGPHFDEFRLSLVFRGTVTIAPDRLIDNPEEFFENPQDISIDFVDARNGFTYQIEVHDVTYADQQPDGTFEVEYQKPGYDEGTTESVTIPTGFRIVSLTT